jgi:YegS/Rv2252/BmrU family lipid kinase
VSISRALVIVNPASNHGETADVIPVVTELLSGCLPFDLVATDGPAHARSLAAEARGYDTLIAVGGDGTVHEVLNGIMCHTDDTRPRLALIPTGSGNDYARTLGISTDLSQAVLQLGTGRRRSVDVGTCNERFYANTLAIGVDAQVTAKAVELKLTTERSGLLLYLTALLHVLFKEYRTYRLRVAFDDEEPSELDITLVAATHGPTYGGGFTITPQALGDDGLIDICIVDAIPMYQALLRFPFIIPGRHRWMSVVHMDRRKRVRVWSETPVPGQIDGEVMLEDHYDIGVLPSALEVIGGEEDL